MLNTDCDTVPDLVTFLTSLGGLLDARPEFRELIGFCDVVGLGAHLMRALVVSWDDELLPVRDVHERRHNMYCRRYLRRSPDRWVRDNAVMLSK